MFVLRFSTVRPSLWSHRDKLHTQLNFRRLLQPQKTAILFTIRMPQEVRYNTQYLYADSNGGNLSRKTEYAHVLR